VGLYKRGSTWWIDVTTRGKRIRQSAETEDKQAAKEYHDQVKAETWRAEKLGEKPQRSWDEAAVRFLKEAEGKASLKDYKRQIEFWTEHFRGRALDSIQRHEAADLIEAKAHAPATRNRYIACLRATLMKAAGDWEWLHRCPKFKTYAEPQHRIRWITKEEAARLLKVLPSWMQPMATFALATGIRQANLLGLRWSQVDLRRRVGWIHADQAKARRAIGIPLNDDAIGALTTVCDKHRQRVFVGPDGLPLDAWTWEARKAWTLACLEAKIERFRWHDLRHTWASWHVQHGTPLLTLKELGGWATLEMVQRYAHLAPEHLSAYAGNARLRDNVTTKTQEPFSSYA